MHWFGSKLHLYDNILLIRYLSTAQMMLAPISMCSPSGKVLPYFLFQRMHNKNDSQTVLVHNGLESNRATLYPIHQPRSTKTEFSHSTASFWLRFQCWEIPKYQLSIIQSNTRPSERERENSNQKERKNHALNCSLTEPDGMQMECWPITTERMNHHTPQYIEFEC